MKIKDIGEGALIKRIWEIFGRKNEDEDVHFYDFGDKYLLLAMDIINEGFHFEKDWDPNLIGKFLVDINLSDIASKNGRPKEMMTSMSFPRDLDEEWVSSLVHGMKSELSKYGVDFSGGDMKESTKISLTGLVIGEVEKGKEFRRMGAKPGDYIYITSKIGRNENAIFDYYTGNEQRYREILSINPRLDVLKILNKHKVTSCIDNSDGVFRSLGILSSLNHLRMNISNDVCYEQVDDEYRKYIYSIGGDYELIFTSPDKIDYFPFLGTVSEGTGVSDVDGRIEIPKGFEHFNSGFIER